MLVGEPLDEVDLRADAEDGARRRGPDRPDDEVGRADLVGELDDIVGALGVHDHDPVGVLGAERLEVGGPEPLMDRAMSLPQQERGRLDPHVVETPELEAGVPHRHVRGGVAEVERGVAPEVLVGEEQDLVAACRAPVLGIERPRQHRSRIRRGAHRPAVASDERLQRRRRVHVGDRHDPTGVGHFAECGPCLFDSLDVGHVGHRAAGIQVGEQHLLVGLGEDVGRFGHEVHAAKDDEVGLRAVCRDARQAERVAAHIGPGHDLVTLVVVAQNEQPLTERRLRGRDTSGELFGRRVPVALGKRLLQPDHVVYPLWGALRYGRRGQPGRPSAGLSASVRGVLPGYQAGAPSVGAFLPPATLFFVLRVLSALLGPPAGRVDHAVGARKWWQ